MKTMSIGQKFGQLEVISLTTSMKTPKGKSSMAYVICRCDCGAVKIIYKGHLFKGDRKTCGARGCSKRNFIRTVKAKNVNGYGLTSDGYRRVWVGHKQMLVHRAVMEGHLNRKLKSNETVHHLNGIKTDNRIENLKVLTDSVHSKTHSEKLIEIALLRKHVQDLELRVMQLEQERSRFIKVS